MAAEQAVPADAGSITDEMLQQKLALILPADAVATFMGIWAGTGQIKVEVNNVPPSAALDPASVANFPELALSYDQVRQAQILTYRGALSDAHVTELQAANSSPMLGQLLAKVTAVEGALFNSFLSPFMAEQDFQQLLVPSSGRAAAFAAKLFP